MTGSNDLDRLLVAYLDEGPRRSPDRPVDAAIAFARAHPRRPDPLLFLRPDVMARRGSLFAPQLAWAVLVIALTLGAVAAVAIGTRPNEDPLVPPPSGLETVPSTVAPSAPPSASPSPQAFEVVVVDEHDIRHPVRVVDRSGTVADVEAGPVHDGEAMPGPAAVTADPAAPERALVAWSFVGCDDPTTVTIDQAGSAIVVERPRCEGDALGGNPLQMTLTFAEPVDVSAFEIELVETP